MTACCVISAGGILRNSFWSLSQFRRLDARAVFPRRVRPSNERASHRSLRYRLFLVHSSYWPNVRGKRGWEMRVRATSRLKEKRGVFFLKNVGTSGYLLTSLLDIRNFVEFWLLISMLLCSPLPRIPAARVRGLRLVYTVIGLVKIYRTCKVKNLRTVCWPAVLPEEGNIRRIVPLYNYLDCTLASFSWLMMRRHVWNLAEHRCPTFTIASWISIRVHH